MINGKVNVLQLVNGFAVGGAERKLLQLVENLDKDRYNIIVCNAGQNGPLQEYFEKIGVKVVIMHPQRAIDFSLLFKVKKLIEQEHIHILQSTLLYADIIGGISARLSRVPVAISWETVAHGPDDVLRIKPLHRISYRFAMRYVDKIVAVSNDVKASIIKHSKIIGDKITTIPYGVDLTKFNDTFNGNVRQEFNLSPDDTIIGCVARLEPWKGFTYLVPAAVSLIQKFPKLKFVFVGDGSLRGYIENEIKKNNVEDKFRLLGVRNDVHRILPMFDIFCLPSTTEGLPNVILEAMACHKTVVASDVGGIPELVVNNKTGVLVPSKNVDALEKAFSDLLLDRSKIFRMGKEGRARVEQQFSLESEVGNFQKLYEEQLAVKGIVIT